MTFNSLQFLVFFAGITAWFFLLPRQRPRIWLLLTASCYFYMSFIPRYIFILGGIIVIDYFAGIQIEKSAGTMRKFWLWLSIVADIGTLCVFKYYNFFIDNIHDAFFLFGKPFSLPLLKMALPIGLSFHTFQALSYTIEVYRGNQRAEKNFSVYALYVMFYPQLVAGPIERPQNILPQLKEFRPYNWDHVKDGFARMLWGFFKKVVIADRLAMSVDHVFSHTKESSSIVLITGAILYYFQIYCDFSGYSDIALGSAKVMNITLMENFNQPFFSKNLSDFWRRWHISLYSWFFDYMFNPLVITWRRHRDFAIIFGLLFVFTLSGLWHGAAWHHILYGLIHGVALVVEYVTRKPRMRLLGKIPPWLNNTLGIAFTFSFISLTRIFFRAETVASGWQYLKGIFTLKVGSADTGLYSVELIFSFFVIILLLVKERLLPTYTIRNNKVFYAFSIFMIAICYLFGVFGENQFIYFQF